MNGPHRFQPLAPAAPTFLNTTTTTITTYLSLLPRIPATQSGSLGLHPYLPRPREPLCNRLVPQCAMTRQAPLACACSTTPIRTVLNSTIFRTHFTHTSHSQQSDKQLSKTCNDFPHTNDQVQSLMQRSYNAS